MNPTAYPLTWPDGWPRIPAQNRERSRFRTSYAGAFDNLMNELSLLGASSIVVSSNAPLRRDGRPYTDAMADDLDDPGVAVWFLLRGEPRVMARDGHPTPAENLHAIGHVIGHLRGLERHGGAYMMTRAFSAFAALPAPTGQSKRSWREILGFHDIQLPCKAAIDHAWREKARAAHPDAGGSNDAMAELNRARAEALAELSKGAS